MKGFGERKEGRREGRGEGSHDRLRREEVVRSSGTECVCCSERERERKKKKEGEPAE